MLINRKYGFNLLRLKFYYEIMMMTYTECTKDTEITF